MVRDQLFDVALVDCGGIEDPSEKMVQLGQAIPYVSIIALSGNSDPELVRRMLRTRVLRDWLPKSDLQRLPLVLERELAHREVLLDKVTTEVQLGEANERLRTMFDSSGVGMAVLSPARRLTRVNEAFARLLDSTDEVLTMAPWESFIHPDDLEEVQSGLEKLRSGDTDLVNIDVRVVTASGHARWVGMTSSAARDEHGSLLYSILVVQNIESRMAALQKVDASARLSSAILDSVQEGVVALDLEGRCTMVNQRALSILDVSPGQVIGFDFHDLVHPGEWESECRLKAAIDQRALHSAESTFVRTSGSGVEVGFTVSPLGGSEGLVISFRDLTEEKRLRERYDEISRLDSLGKIAGKIAHEFNNVLMGIRPFGEVIMRRSAGDPLLEDAARRIEYSVARGVRVTSEILRFARPAALDRSVMTVAELLNELRRETSTILSGSNCSVRIEDRAGDQEFEVDQYQLLQVLVNLVMNARDAMPTGGVILIVTSEVEGRFIDIEVTDFGSGIAAEDIDSIFEPMFTTKSRGTGLGLAVARQIVIAHEGSLTVSSHPGEGATFRIRLPVAQRFQ